MLVAAQLQLLQQPFEQKCQLNISMLCVWLHMCVYGLRVCILSNQGQQVEEKPGVLADEVVGLATQVYKQLETAGGTLASVDDVCHVRGQNERRSVPDGKDGGEELNSASEDR